MKTLSFYSFFLFLFLLSNIYCTPTFTRPSHLPHILDKLPVIMYDKKIGAEGDCGLHRFLAADDEDNL